MKPKITRSFTSAIVFTALSFSFCGNNTGKRNTGPAQGFAVIELFTSEGCSSCPPADEAVIKLAKEVPDHVYFLGYHVDYWDYIGWKDAFSNVDFTTRQNKYAEVFGLSSIFTPQVVVNGEKEFVGSRESQLRATIREELKGRASSGIDPIAIGLTAKSNGENNITASYKVTNADKVLLNIALVQLKATTNVKRGENNGHQLNHINVVRALKTIAIDKGPNASIDFKIPSGLSSKDVKLIAFVQDKNNWKITGATEAAVQ
jgi:hypothetical protein